MKLRAALCAVAVMLLAAVFSAGSVERDAVEAARLTEANWDGLVPEGKEVDAIYGDYVLRNRHLVAVIAQPLATRHANMTVRDVGGALIDLTDREHQSDQLSAYYPGRRNATFRAARVLGEDGKETAAADADENGQPAAVQYTGDAAAVVMRAAASDGKPAVEVTYRLEAGAKHLTITTKFVNESDKPLTVPLEDDLRADGGKEEMVKSPNGEMPLYWIHDQFWEQAYSIDALGLTIRSDSSQRAPLLRFLTKSGEAEVTLEPGQSYELTRRIYPGRDLLAVQGVSDELGGRKTYPVRLSVSDRDGRGIARARFEVSQSGKVRGTVNADREGQVETRLPAGEYEVRVSALGVLVAGGDSSLKIRVDERDAVQDLAIRSGDYHPGIVEAAITDSEGRRVPCKVEFIARDGTPQPNFGPESAEYGVKNLRYTPDGTFTQELPAGRYDVIVSRGPEYDAIFKEIAVPPGRTVKLTGKLVRSVETPGWVSSDFHSHSTPSGDNTSSQLGRVLNLVAEHIEFAPCTEHNRVSTYDPHIEALKVRPFVATVSGIELTGQPLPLNHQNAFPMRHVPRTQDGGGPVTDVDPERQIERLSLWDDRSDKLVQQNHPDIGWLFFDRNGDGKHDSGYERSFALMDVIEVHPIHDAMSTQPVIEGQRPRENTFFNWLRLLNQGYRIPGVVNTDAHYNYHGSGWLRNWIQSSTDDPTKIDPMEMVHAAEEGRLIMSNGPYLEVSLSESGRRESVTAGQDLSASSGKLTLRVRVQCANWLDVDRVSVLVNGKVDERHSYTRRQHPDKFGNKVVKFEQTLDVELDGDAHVIVLAGGEGTTLGKVMGPTFGDVPPAAVSNPIYVDVDGDGFKPNDDTLGHPLPVKFEERRR